MQAIIITLLLAAFVAHSYGAPRRFENSRIVRGDGLSPYLLRKPGGARTSGGSKTFFQDLKSRIDRGEAAGAAETFHRGGIRKHVEGSGDAEKRNQFQIMSDVIHRNQGVAPAQMSQQRMTNMNMIPVQQDNPYGTYPAPEAYRNYGMAPMDAPVAAQMPMPPAQVYQYQEQPFAAYNVPQNINPGFIGRPQGPGPQDFRYL